jgi:two-component system, NtrC family, response regulator HydG
VKKVRAPLFDYASPKPERMDNIIMKKILVVNDDIAHDKMLKTLISDWGYDIFLADDGSTGVEMIKEQSFDIVLMDMKMIKMSGMEALQLIKDYNPSLR